MFHKNQIEEEESNAEFIPKYFQKTCKDDDKNVCVEYRCTLERNAIVDFIEYK